MIKKQAWEKDEKRERFRVTTDSQQQTEGKFSLAGGGRTDLILERLVGEEGCAEFFICLYCFLKSPSSEISQKSVVVVGCCRPF